ncbi:MAG: sigma-70 family RNA polymerase sigma factor [Nocardioides sp.]
MASSEPTAARPSGHGTSRRGWDDASLAWVADLMGTGTVRELAVGRLHALMVRVGRAEAARRTGWHGIRGPELDDLADQAAGDAVVSILRRVGDFRGESRFTTWASAFVIREVSTKFGRHVWQRDGIRLDDVGWEQVPGRVGERPDAVAEARALMDAVRVAVDEELTEHQRRVFVAIAVQAVPLDVLVAELDTNRNAIYKTMFDARRKVRAHLETHGYLYAKARER